MAKEHVDGFVSARLRRSVGTPTKYLILVIYRNKVAARGNQGIPKSRELVASHLAANDASVSPKSRLALSSIA